MNKAESLFRPTLQTASSLWSQFSPIKAKSCESLQGADQLYMSKHLYLKISKDSSTDKKVSFYKWNNAIDLLLAGSPAMTVPLLFGSKGYNTW